MKIHTVYIAYCHLENAVRREVPNMSRFPTTRHIRNRPDGRWIRYFVSASNIGQTVFGSWSSPNGVWSRLISHKGCRGLMRLKHPAPRGRHLRYTDCRRSYLIPLIVHLLHNNTSCKIATWATLMMTLVFQFVDHCPPKGIPEGIPAPVGMVVSAPLPDDVTCKTIPIGVTFPYYINNQMKYQFNSLKYCIWWKFIQFI